MTLYNFVELITEKFKFEVASNEAIERMNVEGKVLAKEYYPNVDVPFKFDLVEKGGIVSVVISKDFVDAVKEVYPEYII